VTSSLVCPRMKAAFALYCPLLKRIVSGFVPERFVRTRSKGLPARVAGVVASPPEKGKVRVLLPGEVLTSTNPILVDASWLSVHAA